LESNSKIPKILKILEKDREKIREILHSENRAHYWEYNIKRKKTTSEKKMVKED